MAGLEHQKINSRMFFVQRLMLAQQPAFIRPGRHRATYRTRPANPPPLSDLHRRSFQRKAVKHLLSKEEPTIRRKFSIVVSQVFRKSAASSLRFWPNVATRFVSAKSKIGHSPF